MHVGQQEQSGFLSFPKVPKLCALGTAEPPAAAPVETPPLFAEVIILYHIGEPTTALAG